MPNQNPALNDFFAKCENGDLLIRLGLVNDFSSFRRILTRDELFVFLKQEISVSSLNLIEQIKERIINLVDSTENDPSKLHPYDVAIAAYLLLISEVNQEEADNLSSLIQNKEINNAWWIVFSLAYIKTISSHTTQIMNNYSSDQKTEFKTSVKESSFENDSVTDLVFNSGLVQISY